MRQVVRRVIDRKGKVVVLELPAPHAGPAQILVQAHYSLISSGTEMTTLSKTPLELVKQTLSDPWMRHVVTQTILGTGLTQTVRRVWLEMVAPREIGYSGAGRILDIGKGVKGFEVGQKVAYAATGHAEIAAPTLNHIAPVPESLELRHAAFVTVGGIAIHALRRADLQFGEVVAIYGMGLVGQLCAMIAKAAGCVVVGIDVEDSRNELAESRGIDLTLNPAKVDLPRRIQDLTDKRGVDATIICASSSSNQIINSSMKITRKQGRVVLVGYVKLDIHPKNFLHREIDLRYSRAYGPGSYHRAYETGRVDYPFGYVRWTEKRNLEEFIRLVSSGLDLEPLIDSSFPVERAQEAFDRIARGSLDGVAVLLDFHGEKPPDRRRTLEIQPGAARDGRLGVSIIGCGNHFLSKHLPHLKSLRDIQIRALGSATGKNASVIAGSCGATAITTDVGELLADPELDAVLICSGHSAHYEHLKQTLEAKKPVFVEKPMVTDTEDLRSLFMMMRDRSVLFTLGLNRRYSSTVSRLREVFEGPILSVQYLVSQPLIPQDHWTLDPVDGGGRLICEAEHFIDLCNHLIDGYPLTVGARALGHPPEELRSLSNYAITLHYAEAQASIVFAESGSSRFPRERLTVLGHGQVAILDDFATLRVHHGGRRKRQAWNLKRSMGHLEALQEFVAAVRGEPNKMLTWEEASQATLCMFAAEESIRTGTTLRLEDFESQLLQPKDQALKDEPEDPLP